ncbi:MAG: carboxypeptidase M32 [Clostridia bacterium]|nr:carboxypeptidase M32 [Clostridia bacterium]
MEFNKALERFKEIIKLSNAYTYAMGVITFDSETAAPKNSVMGRANASEIFSGITYKLTVNEEYFEVLDTLSSNKDKLDAITAREVELAVQSLSQIRHIPIEEYTEYRKTLTYSQNAWVQAKRNDDYSIFAPYLEKIIAFHRRVASLVAPDMDPYDYWLDQYEQELSTKTLDAFFDKVRASIVPLIKRVSERGDIIRTDFLERHCPIELQRRLSDYVMQLMHISRDDCAIAESEHPFTLELDKHDVRITTHYHEERLISNLYSVIHEGGHALYELNIGDDLIDTALAGGTSMSVHESQSRFYENIIGRSRAFVEILFPKIKELFPEQYKDVSLDEFYLAVNKAQPSLKRMNADELTYAMHIMVRYELEKRMMHGEITVDELPAEWNRLYKEYLGIEVPSNREGILQDVHWGGGMIGYFPSYALGSAYGAQMVEAIKKDLDFDELIKNDRINEITAWLTERIYRFGRLLKPGDAVRAATGKDFDPQYFIDYLTEKYTAIYGLDKE